MVAGGCEVADIGALTPVLLYACMYLVSRGAMRAACLKAVAEKNPDRKEREGKSNGVGDGFVNPAWRLDSC